MSVDPHGYPWPDTPPMTTTPDDPRADDGLVRSKLMLKIGGPLHLKLVAGRGIDDPEKAVLPALIWTTKSEGNLKVYALAVGWWDWHLTLLWGRALTAARSHRGM